VPRVGPLPLRGVRIADLTWVLASAGTSTLLASLGAEVIRIEWPTRLDFTRIGATAGVGVHSRETTVLPLGAGKQEFPAKTGSGTSTAKTSVNRSGVFNDRNPGKYGITLNMGKPEGRELFKRLLTVSDVVMDGFRAPTLSRWGLSYESMCAVKQDIIYLQMSGFGNSGPYREFGSLGPVAAAHAGLAFQNGLPEPAPPTSWNHSYMDTTPPFYGALAVMAALRHRRRTGKGQYIDQAQYQTGLFLGGTAVLDYSANGRRSVRHGNRSPYLDAAPHGIYRCKGEDEWIAIATFTEEEWRALCDCMGNPSWSNLERFASLSARLDFQDELDELVEGWTRQFDRYELMYELQSAGVSAGVVQTHADKVETDPQLKVRDFFVHLDHSELGTWPFTRHLTPKMSLTPPHPGGVTQRGAPCLGEDNDYVYADVLGLTRQQIEDFAALGVI
jgi:crotonobetainyl-CoA:carnitine CoA-transferase CaiB-like acyl-CoA transferase